MLTNPFACCGNSFIEKFSLVFSNFILLYFSIKNFADYKGKLIFLIFLISMLYHIDQVCKYECDNTLRYYMILDMGLVNLISIYILIKEFNKIKKNKKGILVCTIGLFCFSINWFTKN